MTRIQIWLSGPEPLPYFIVQLLSYNVTKKILAVYRETKIVLRYFTNGCNFLCYMVFYDDEILPPTAGGKRKEACVATRPFVKEQNWFIVLLQTDITFYVT